MGEMVVTYVSEAESGTRLDVFLAGAIEDASRSWIKKLIAAGSVERNGKVCVKPAQTVIEGDEIHIHLPDPKPAEPVPENIPIEILYEDDDLIVVNKPSGMVVHPAPGHETSTLVNALLYHCPGYQTTGGDPRRPGIVHRLDRDTSGVMVVAKTPRAYGHLAQQAAEHRFLRHYLALVRGEFKEQYGRISASIGRSLVDAARMAVTGIRAKEAVTNFEVLERFGVASYLRLTLETGRTHQIRVHLQFAGRPILGDAVYGETRYDTLGLPTDVCGVLANLHGQALHAEVLGFVHPATGKTMTFVADIPADFAAAIKAFRAFTSSKIKS